VFKLGKIINFLKHFFLSIKTFMEVINTTDFVKFEVDQTILNFRNNQIILNFKMTINSANKFKVLIRQFIEKKFKYRFEIPRNWNCEIFGSIPGNNLIDEVHELISIEENNTRYLNLVAFSKVAISDNSIFTLRLMSEDLDHMDQKDFVYYKPESYPERDFENKRDIYNKQVEEINSLVSSKFRIDGISLDVYLPADIYLFDLFPKEIKALFNQIDVLSTEIENTDEIYQIPSFKIIKLKKDFLNKTGYDIEDLIKLEIDINAKLVYFIKDEYRNIFIIRTDLLKDKPVLVNINPIINTHISFDTRKLRVQNVFSLIIDCSITSDNRKLDFDVILDYDYLTVEFKKIVKQFFDIKKRLVKKTTKKSIPENDRPFWG
jgi:hypothetical protein